MHISHTQQHTHIYTHTHAHTARIQDLHCCHHTDKQNGNLDPSPLPQETRNRMHSYLAPCLIFTPLVLLLTPSLHSIPSSLPTSPLLSSLLRPFARFPISSLPPLSSYPSPTPFPPFPLNPLSLLPPFPPIPLSSFPLHRCYTISKRLSSHKQRSDV